MRHFIFILTQRISLPAQSQRGVSNKKLHCHLRPSGSEYFKYARRNTVNQKVEILVFTLGLNSDPEFAVRVRWKKSI